MEITTRRVSEWMTPVPRLRVGLLNRQTAKAMGVEFSKVELVIRQLARQRVDLFQQLNILNAIANWERRI